MEHSRLVDLITRAQQGDKNALEELYVDIFNSVFRLALRMVKNPEDAEDITQEVYITVQEKISDLREPKAFYAWVNQITANKCNLILNKYKGIAKLDEEEEILALIDDDPANMPDKALDDEATRKLIMDVIDNLPDNQRVCIILFYYAQFTVVQIAETLETNENTIKTRLSIARAKIRKALEELAENKGIKLWGIPLPLTPILREAIESMPVPDGLYARVLENIHSAQQMNSSDTLGQADPKLEVEIIAINYEITGANYESITPNYEIHTTGKDTTNMSNNFQPINTSTVICPGCGSSLPPNITVCFRCAKNLHEQAPIQNNQNQYTPQVHATYANPMSSVTPVATATAVNSSATGIIIAVVATVVVFFGGTACAHIAGWVDLPFLPERTEASTQDVIMQTPQEREQQKTDDISSTKTTNQAIETSDTAESTEQSTDIIDPGMILPEALRIALSEGTFEGELDENGLFAGWGVWIYHNHRYEGYFGNGIPNGTGTLSWATKDRMGYSIITVQGNWIDGLANGEVTFRHYLEGEYYDTFNVVLTNGRVQSETTVTTQIGTVIKWQPSWIYGVPPWAEKITEPSLAPPE